MSDVDPKPPPPPHTVTNDVKSTHMASIGQQHASMIIQCKSMPTVDITDCALWLISWPGPPKYSQPRVPSQSYVVVSLKLLLRSKAASYAAAHAQFLPSKPCIILVLLKHVGRGLQHPISNVAQPGL